MTGAFILTAIVSGIVGFAAGRVELRWPRRVADYLDRPWFPER